MSTRDVEVTQFVRERGPALRRYAYLLTGDRERAEDLLQDSLVKVYAAWHRIEDHRSAEAYTRTVITRTQCSWWRRSARREYSTDTVPDRPVEDIDAVARQDMRMLLAGLSPQRRAVVVLRFYEDYSEAQIASTLGISLGTVKSTLHRALGHLRTQLEQRADEEVWR